MQTSATYTITYNIQNIHIEVQTQDIEFALWLSVEKEQISKSNIMSSRELLQLYISTAHELYLQEQKNTFLRKCN